jgi:hypothetical protein
MMMGGSDFDLEYESSLIADGGQMLNLLESNISNILRSEVNSVSLERSRGIGMQRSPGNKRRSSDAFYYWSTIVQVLRSIEALRRTSKQHCQITSFVFYSKFIDNLILELRAISLSFPNTAEVPAFGCKDITTQQQQRWHYRRPK